MALPAKKEDTQKKKYVKWISELSSKDVLEVGGKGANLGEMTSIKLPVPIAFVVTAKSYEEFLEKSGIKKEIYDKLSELDIEKTDELDKVSKEIQQLIETKEIPEEIQEVILEEYEHISVDEEALKGASKDALDILNRAKEPIFVAVRSSATSEDSPEASFAGQQKTILNVKGKTALIKAVRDCWASLFGSRSIYYRVRQGFEHENTAIAVVVQKMVNPEKSGVIFTKNPMGTNDNIVIEAVFGLGEGIVSGMIAPDNYEVNRELKTLNVKLANKKLAIVRNSSGANETVKLTAEKSKSQVLTSYEVKKLAQLAMDIENHYNKPQDIEFAIDSQEIYIVQTRPITTLDKKTKQVSASDSEKIKGKEILSGLAASPGIGSGGVKIIHNLSELNKVKQGDVLVTEMTNPDMVVAMQKAAAIITDEGGQTAHAAIVSREMGIPAIVGTETATTTLKDGDEVTVDGFTGKIYSGKGESKKVEILPIEEGTKTKIKVIVDLPHFASRAALTKSKSVGLTRMEGIIAESGKHPMYFVKENKLGDYENLIYNGIKQIAEPFEEVWVRTSDLRSDEYSNLEGASKDIEANPMLGMHGIRSSLKYPDILRSELKALKRVADEGGKKIGVLTPQVISVDELKGLKKYIQEVGFHNIRVGIMIETPAAVQIIEDLCNEGIDFISFGTNDLTQYTLAVDRGNEDVQELYNEEHPAVIKQIEHVIRVCKEKNVETSICGQAGSKENIVRKLFAAGIDSISVNADKARDISVFVKGLELEKTHGETQESPGEKEVVEEHKEEEHVEPVEPVEPVEHVEEEKEEPKRVEKIESVEEVEPVEETESEPKGEEVVGEEVIEEKEEIIEPVEEKEHGEQYAKTPLEEEHTEHEEVEAVAEVPEEHVEDHIEETKEEEKEESIEEEDSGEEVTHVEEIHPDEEIEKKVEEEKPPSAEEIVNDEEVLDIF